MIEARNIEKNTKFCSNPKCKKGFDKPKLIYVCPHCLTEIQEDKESNCRHWFGYLGNRENGEEIPNECIECPKSIECMLKEKEYSERAKKEINKWY